MTHSTQGQHTQQLATLTNSLDEANSSKFCICQLLPLSVMVL